METVCRDLRRDDCGRIGVLPDGADAVPDDEPRLCGRGAVENHAEG